MAGTDIWMDTLYLSDIRAIRDRIVSGKYDWADLIEMQRLLERTGMYDQDEFLNMVSIGMKAKEEAI